MNHRYAHYIEQVVAAADEDAAARLIDHIRFICYNEAEATAIRGDAWDIPRLWRDMEGPRILVPEPTA
jgi:hypothetical protein